MTLEGQNFWNNVSDELVNRNSPLTSEELYSICKRHKALDNKDKSWDRLAELVDIGKSGDALRAWTYRHQEEDGTVKRDMTKLTDKTVNELSSDEAKEALDKQLADIYKAKTQVRDTWNAYRRDLRAEARKDSMKESLIDAMKNVLPELPSVEPEVFDFIADPSEAILLISDMHLGVECDNYYNIYNSKIAAERLSKLVVSTKHYCKLHGVMKLNIINLGDMIQGIIHTNARLEQEFDVTQEIMKAAELLAQTLNELQNVAPVVTYRSVTDNHSRAMANLSEHIEQENFNKIIDWYIEERLKDSKIKFLHDNIDDGIGMFNLNNGKKVMFSHGHQDKKQSCVQDMIGLTQEWVDYVLMAHFHNSAEHTFQNVKVFINGSIVGTEQYAFGKRLFSKPSQKLLIFYGNDVCDIDMML